MQIYCIEDFKKEFNKLISKNSYKSLETEIIKYFFDKPTNELLSGTRLNNSDKIPYIKKRIGGSGSFRCYFFILIKEGSLYLMFVHPKSGSMGASNINDKSKAYLYKKVLDCIQKNQLYTLTLNNSRDKIIFKKNW